MMTISYLLVFYSLFFLFEPGKADIGSSVDYELDYEHDEGPSFVSLPKHNQVDYSSWCRGNCQRCFNHDVVYFTSFHAKWFTKTQQKSFFNTIFESFYYENLIVYSEDDLSVFALEDYSICYVNLHKAFPWLESVLKDPESGLNEYYAENEFIDPFRFGKRGDVMKVLSMYHAVLNSRDNSIAIWLDTDVSFREQMPTDVVEWIRERDVVYCPFVGYEAGAMPQNAFDYLDLNSDEGQRQALLGEFWSIESGVFALTVNSKTLALMEKVMWMYRSGMRDLARGCLAGLAFCKRERVLHDVSVLNLLLQADAHEDSDIFSVGLKHGWFAIRGKLNYWEGRENLVWGANKYLPNFVASNNNHSLGKWKLNNS